MSVFERTEVKKGTIPRDGISKKACKKVLLNRLQNECPVGVKKLLIEQTPSKSTFFFPEGIPYFYKSKDLVQDLEKAGLPID